MNLRIDWIIIINITGALNALFFALVIIGTKKRRKIPRFILGTLMIVIFMFLAHSILLQSNGYFEIPHLFGIFSIITYLLGPLLFFYVKALITPNFVFKKKYFLHFIPFILRFILATPFFIKNTEEKLRVIETFIDFQNWKDIFLIGVSHNLVYLGVYLILIIRLLTGHNRNIKEMYSSIEKMKLVWMKYLVFAYTSLIGTYFGTYFLFCLFALPGEILLQQARRVISLWETMLVFIIGYKGLTQPEIFTSHPIHIPAEKYKSSNLTPNDAEKYRKKLATIMETEKPFLKENLTIKELSEKMTISPRHLSQILNEKLKQNFYDFINRYRVEEAKRQLIQHQDQKKPILIIAYDVGFNSKSTFNTVFKKYTKMTPTQFRKNHY